MHITIENIQESTDELVFSGWKVTHGDKYADGLGYDEMIGLVAAITMPEERRLLQWLKTKEQHQAQKDHFKNMAIKDGPLYDEMVVSLADKISENNFEKI